LWLTPCFAQPAVARRSSPPHRAAPPRGASPLLRLRRPHRPSWFPRRPRCILVPRVHEAEPPSSISCAAPPPAATHRRRPPPTPRHRQCSCAIRAVGLRSDAPVQSRRPQATVALGSRSNGSRSGQNLVNRSNSAGPAVSRKIPQVFRNSQIYPSTLEVFLQISPFSLF
jgi:hypothetical protein